jgi:hypothetical protein
MTPLSADQRESIAAISQRHGFSLDATRVMLDAVAKGQGSMAQFDHPEFGGSGQWMRGGMTMVSDMFNDRLKARVAALCEDLAELGSQAPDMFKSTRPWWPEDLGLPDSAGGQNDVRYAYFARKRRLAIELHGKITVYDTLDHRIHGVSQQQGSHGELAFASQHGTVDIATLPLVR